MNWPSEFDHVFRMLNKVKRLEDYWVACCPGHDDEHPSLSVKVGRTGNLLVNCFGPGCTWKDIVEVLSFQAGRKITLRPWNGGLDTQPKRAKRKGPSVAITRVYPYCDEYGEVLFEAVRLEPGFDGRKKDFRQRRPNPEYNARTDPSDKEFLWNLEGVRMVLYNLPDLFADAANERRRMVWVMEGEKDCESAASLGLLATTNACGAKKFRLAEIGVLKGADVVVPFDRDKVDPKTKEVVGLEHGLQVVNCLHGLAKSVRLLRLPSPGHSGDFGEAGGDFTDWLDQFEPGTEPGLRRERARRFLFDAVRAAPLYDPWGPILPPAPDPFLKRVADAAGRIADDPIRGRPWRPDELGEEIALLARSFASACQRAARGLVGKERLLRMLAELAGSAVAGVKTLRWEDEPDPAPFVPALPEGDVDSDDSGSGG